jgi:hypothetical protein
VSDDEGDNPWEVSKHPPAPWELTKMPPGLQRSVCSRLYKSTKESLYTATKETTDSLTATLDIVSSHINGQGHGHYASELSPGQGQGQQLSGIVEVDETGNAPRDVNGDRNTDDAVTLTDPNDAMLGDDGGVNSQTNDTIDKLLRETAEGLVDCGECATNGGASSSKDDPSLDVYTKQ